MTKGLCSHPNTQLKGRSSDFSPFDMQLMIDDGDLMQDDAHLMQDDAHLMRDDGKVFTDG